MAHEDKHPTRKDGKQQRGKTRAVPDLVSDSKEDDVAELWGDSWGEGGNNNVVATPVCALPVASPSHLHPAPPSHPPIPPGAPPFPPSPPLSDAAHVDSPPCDAHPYRTPLPTFWVSCFCHPPAFGTNTSFMSPMLTQFANESIQPAKTHQFPTYSASLIQMPWVRGTTSFFF